MKAALLCCVLLTCGSVAFACEMPTGAAELIAATPDARPAYVTLDTTPVAQPFQVTFMFCEPMSRISVTAIMPAHQHGMNYEPKIVAVDESSFTASGLMFHMPGAWQIEVRAVGLNGATRYVFDVVAE